MSNIRIIDEVIFKMEIERLYKEYGQQAVVSVLLDLILGGEICLQVIKENYGKTEKRVEP